MVTSPGHKLGQIIGDIFEDLFSNMLVEFAEEQGYYCDRKGSRPSVRGAKQKVSWIDNRGNSHDMDLVIEKDGSYEIQGQPVAFIELAWRRYTKHSRNKAGELQGSLPHLKETYQDSCVFIGAIIGGEWTDGAMNQMKSNGINLLYLPYNDIVECFQANEININYEESASDTEKQQIVNQIMSLSSESIENIKRCIKLKCNSGYTEFIGILRTKLLRVPTSIRITPTFANGTDFGNINDAIDFIDSFSEDESVELTFYKFEIDIRFGNGDRIECSFRNREDARAFLQQFGTEV